MSNGLSNDSRWASVRKRPRRNGTTAYAVLYRIDGRQAAITFNDPRQADALVGLIKAHGAERALSMHGIDVAPRGRGGELTVGSFIDKHITALSGVEKKTRSEYRRYLTRDINPTLGAVPLSALKRTDVSSWVNTLRTAGNSGKTVGNKLGFLSGVLNAAVADGYIPANPAAGIRLPRSIRREMVCLSVAEFNLLKSAFTERWHPLLDLLVTSGLRISEATALQPADIDRQKNIVRVTKAWKRISPTDGSSDRYELGPPKTRRSERKVSVPASVIDNLDLSGEWVFTNSQGGPIRLYSWRSNVWNKSLAKVMTPDPANPDKVLLTRRPRVHDLRHSAASWWLGANVPLIVVSGQLGHDDASTTARVYAHLLDNAGQAAADAMAKLMEPGE